MSVLTAELAAATTVTSRMESAILGKFCENEACSVVRVICTTTIYANGDWVVAFNRPNDPLQGDVLTGSGGCPMEDIMRAMVAVSNRAADGELSQVRR